MKKIVCMLLAICLLVPSLALANGKAKDEPIPDFCKPILEAWNAADAEELYLHLLDYLNEIHPEENGWYTPKHSPLSIRLGGTTKELIADKKNWDLAIVSSKDVDLQELIAHEALESSEYYPDYGPAFYQWLLPDELSYILGEPKQVSDVYVYDYDAQSGEAILLLCNKMVFTTDNPPTPRRFAEEMMWKRSADTARRVQGIRLIPDEAQWSEEDFLSHCDEWDIGILRMKKDQLLSALDQVGLLYDFSKDDYFASRSSVDLLDYLVDLANGVFNADGQMIGIPCVEINVQDTDPNIVGMLIINAKSPCLDRALQYAKHYIKTLEWKWDISREQNGGMMPFISRDDMDW